ncbi:MAG TPA: zinc ribbon domain-containing protein [Pyrinomonadaceae bacterium]
MSDALFGGNSAITNGAGEHTCRRVLLGEVEDVRARLIRALERLDYRLLNEQQPLLARRAARKEIISADMLDVARTLAINLKPSGTAATLAIFDITVVHGQPWGMGKGDRHTLELEIDALVALAAAPDEQSACALCGTENSGGARFCRSCGAPNNFREPAEVELMRLEAGARAAHQEHVFGFLIMLVVAVLALPLIIFSSNKVAPIGWVVFAAGMLLGCLMTLYGVRRLHRTLNPKERKSGQTTPAQPEAIPAPRAAALPPRSARTSVTEGTTELLHTEARERVEVRPRARGGNTDPIE